MNIKPLHNQAQWEAFFLQHGPQALFQSWEWGESLEKSGVFVERFGMWSKDALRGIFQVVKVCAKRGAFLHVRHGPILAGDSFDQLKEFTDFMVDKTKSEHALFFRISPLVSQEKQDMFAAAGYRGAAIHAMDAEVCWVLPINKPIDEIFSSMRKTTRYEIKKAQNMSVTVATSNNLAAFFKLYEQTAKRHSFVRHTGIQEEFEVFAKRNKATLYYASFEGKVIAAAIILFVGYQGIYHHGASVSSSPPGSHLIQWQAIQEAKARGMKEYNFWGIAPDEIPNHPWRGITLFKKGFGGEERRYLHAQDYPVSPLYILPRAVETIRRIRKGY
jgi:lipid II:glycine glycyltransferase (peptidoglycan interpeptide bridge formation enzyme)